MQINTQMSRQEVMDLSQRVDSFNTRLKSEQQIVSKNALGEADFMQLLITQLKTQDPTKPLEDKEFIAQMAQFTALKQSSEMASAMKNMSQEFTFNRSVSLVGKNVTWQDAQSGRFFSGTVDSVRVKNGESFLNIGGNQVSPGAVVEITQAAAYESAAEVQAPADMEEFSSPSGQESRTPVEAMEASAEE